jgi:hypothetical protein
MLTSSTPSKSGSRAGEATRTCGQRQRDTREASGLKAEGSTRIDMHGRETLAKRRERGAGGRRWGATRIARCVPGASLARRRRAAPRTRRPFHTPTHGIYIHGCISGLVTPPPMRGLVRAAGPAARMLAAASMRRRGAGVPGRTAGRRLRPLPVAAPEARAKQRAAAQHSISVTRPNGVETFCLLLSNLLLKRKSLAAPRARRVARWPGRRRCRPSP